jgi:hypothetical protein
MESVMTLKTRVDLKEISQGTVLRLNRGSAIIELHTGEEAVLPFSHLLPGAAELKIDQPIWVEVIGFEPRSNGRSVIVQQVSENAAVVASAESARKPATAGARRAAA